MNWIIGFFVSIVVGQVVVWTARHFMYRRLDVPETAVRAVSGWVMGVTERAIFTLVFAFQVPGAAVSMMVWITLKMLTGWNRPVFTLKGETPEVRAERALGAAFLSLLSMGFALVGGLICNGDIPITWITKFVGGH